LDSIQGSLDLVDRWSYIWNSDEYFAKKAYLQIIGMNHASPIFKWMWKSCAHGKHKFFLWLLLSDRLNTRQLLKWKNMELQDYICVLCSTNSEESLLHLFFECPFSKWCWRMLNIHWNTSLTPQDMLIKGRRQFNCKIFREVIMVAQKCHHL
jgi:hypothetical protein